MEDMFERKYQKVLEMLPDLAEITHSKLILVGGTALTIFYLKHRASIDIDLVPSNTEEVNSLKEMIKGALSKKGYQTQRAAHKNQFVVNFDNTSIKIEVFNSEHVIKKIEEFEVSGKKISVASLSDLFEMKLLAYKDRKESRDLFDLIEILKKENRELSLVKELVKKYGKPERVDDVAGMAFNDSDYLEFVRAIEDVT